VPADLVVMAVGIRPNTALAESAGISLRAASAASWSTTPCRPTTRASTPSASAPTHRGTAYGLVAPLFEQAKVCANHLAMFGIGRYQGSVTSTKLKVTGIDVFSAGDFMGGERN
jgi:nitrite reductase (NADH) large subunit